MFEKIVKSVLPYNAMPKGLRKVVKNLARTHKPHYTSSLPGTAGTLDCLIAYNKLGAYCTPLSSQQRPVVQQILKGRVHEEETIDFVRRNCAEGDIIHAGTYFGDFLPGLSAGLSPRAILWAFEPNLENFRCAQITSLLNGLQNVDLRNAGLAETSSIRRMAVQTREGINLGGASMIVDEGTDAGGSTVDVHVVSVDDIIPELRMVTVIQLDIEGFEINALKGALRTIRRCKPILILEDNHDDFVNNEWFRENILSLGYHPAGKVHMNSVFKT